LGAWGGFREKSSAIDSLDLRFLREWCDECSELAPALLARIVSIANKDASGAWEMSDASMMLIDNFSHVDGVLDALSASINTFSWSGSLIPFYERQIEVLTPLLKHQQEMVRVWTQRMLDGANANIAQEVVREEEQKVGR